MNAKNEILEELRLLSAVVNDISRETPYRVPAGYFDGFPALILSLTGEVTGTERPFFATEKDKSLTFSVPEGYFEGFAGSVMAKIKNSSAESAGDEISRLSPFLAGLPRSMPYSVPVNFFQSAINDLSYVTGNDPSFLKISCHNRRDGDLPPLGRHRRRRALHADRHQCGQ